MQDFGICRSWRLDLELRHLSLHGYMLETHNPASSLQKSLGVQALLTPYGAALWDKRSLQLAHGFLGRLFQGC